MTERQVVSQAYYLSAFIGTSLLNLINQVTAPLPLLLNEETKTTNLTHTHVALRGIASMLSLQCVSLDDPCGWACVVTPG